jgi:hypothetical protein
MCPHSSAQVPEQAVAFPVDAARPKMTAVLVRLGNLGEESGFDLVESRDASDRHRSFSA